MRVKYLLELAFHGANCLQKTYLTDEACKKLKLFLQPTYQK